MSRIRNTGFRKAEEEKREEEKRRKEEEELRSYDKLMSSDKMKSNKDAGSDSDDFMWSIKPSVAVLLFFSLFYIKYILLSFEKGHVSDMFRLLVTAAVKQRIIVRAIFSEPVRFFRISSSSSMASFTYPQDRRDESVVDDYHGTKVSQYSELFCNFFCWFNSVD